MNKTSIDWPGLAYSWNPIVGCKHGCHYCYARKLVKRFKMIPDFEKPVFFPARITEPLSVSKPSTIFVGSMCDIFSPGVEDDWINQIVEMARICDIHTFMFLTKNPARYSEFEWSKNCWLGMTMETDGMLDRYTDFMFSFAFNKSFISIEPIQSSFEGFGFSGINLIIVGADSTPGAPVPPLEWVKSIQHSNIYYKANLRKHYPELKNSHE